MKTNKEEFEKQCRDLVTRKDKSFSNMLEGIEVFWGWFEKQLKQERIDELERVQKMIMGNPDFTFKDYEVDEFLVTRIKELK
jgi:hypothetical protein